MSEKLILSIVTPEKLLVSEEVDQVNVPGSEGDLGILYDHAPILTNLRSGRVTILAETGEFVHEIDRERAERAQAQAEELLGKTDLSEEGFIETQKILFRAIARLENSENN